MSEMKKDMDLQARIRELEADNARLKEQLAVQAERPFYFSPVPAIDGAPADVAPLIEKAMTAVVAYFRDFEFNPARAHIDLGGEPYVLMRGSALSYEFLDAIVNVYADRGQDEAISVGKDLLYDIGHVVGMKDARRFQQRMGITDSNVMIFAGPFYFAFSGWAFVDLPSSVMLPDSTSMATMFEHPFSIEAQSWIRAGKRAPKPICIISAGYSSGWCEASLDSPLTCVEISCRACGDDCCRFIMAPPDQIEHYLERYATQTPAEAPRRYDIPTFFDRKRIEEEMAAARRNAEESERLKSLFLATTSHEIRTPLSAIMGSVELLLSRPQEQEDREYLSAIRSSGNLLMSILNDVLDFSKIEAGQMTIEDTLCNLEDIFTTIGANAHSMAVQYQRTTLDLRARFSPDIAPFIVSDPVRIQQVINNLIGNAIKFTAEGYVEYGAYLQAEVLTLYVEDTGIGIPEDRQQAIFSSFEQGDTSITRRFGGTGLGLAISKRLAELMGGSLDVESTPGRGSRFSFTIPYRPAQPVQPATGDSLASLGGEGRLVLLVEDNELNHKITRALLEKSGYRVLSARDGQEAIDLVEQHQDIALILMDMQMPVLDGLSATKRIREREHGGARIPIIALTAHALADEIDRCIAAGCDDHITKPIDHAKLSRTMAAMLPWRS